MVSVIPPVAITGMGCVCTAGPDLARCLKALDAGRRCPVPPSRFPVGTLSGFPVFEVPSDYLDCGRLKNPGTSNTVRLALRATREALQHAGIPEMELSCMRVGVCMGTSVGASLNFLDCYRAHRAGSMSDTSGFSRYLSANPAMAVAFELGVRGPVQTVVNACSSGADAIGMAASWIRQGLCDVAIAGGGDEISEVAYTGFIRLMITDNEPCRPFDATRKGLNLGEGAGVVVMESEGFRARRGASVLAELRGYGTIADAYHLTAPHPEGLGLRKAVAAALAEAGLQAKDIAFINAHGTATPNNDLVESVVFRDIFSSCPIVATKGMTGHTLGAAGAIEAIFAIAHLVRGMIPATVGFAHTDPELGIVPTTTPVTITGRAAISQSLAFGGNNSVLVLSRGAPE